MIIDAIISLPIAVLSYIVGLLPTYSGLPSTMSTAIDYILNMTLKVGDILPTATMWQVALSIMTIELAIMGFRTVAWLLHWNQPQQG